MKKPRKHVPKTSNELFGTERWIAIASSEKPLIDAARRGDDAAFEQLYKLHLGHIRNTAIPILMLEDDVDDVTQEVFLLAWTNLKTFRGDSTFRTWVTSIARRQCFAYLSKRRTRPSCSLELTGSSDYQPWEKAGGAYAIEAKFDLSRLIRGLAAPSQTLVALNLEGFSDLEIARITGLSLRGVRGRRQRAIGSMRKEIFSRPEHLAARPSLIYDATNSLEATPQMGAKASQKKRPVEGRATRKPVRRPAAAQGLPPSPVSGADLLEQFVRETEQLEYLAAIERRREFEAEIVNESFNRLQASISKFLAEHKIDRCHEWPVLCRLAKVMSSNKALQGDCARLQRLPVGDYSRDLRLNYVAGAAHHLLPEVVDEVLAIAEKGGK